MRLQLRGVIGSGAEVLDRGITDLQTAVIGGRVHLFTSTGRNGGISDYTIGVAGNATLTSSVIFPETITGIVSDTLVLAVHGTGYALLTGGTGAGLLGFSLTGQGSLAGQIGVSWAEAETSAAQGSLGHLEALVAVAGTPPTMFPGSFDCSQIVDMAQISVAGQTIVLVACAVTNGVTAFLQAAGSGALTSVGSAGAATGLGVDAPSAMEVVTMGGQTYVLLAAANTSSLSVMRVMSDGSLVPTDHVVDTGATLFKGVQTLDVARVGEHVFVVAGGTDNGVTLFTLLPDGTLITLQSLSDTGATTMHKVTAISLAVQGSLLHVFVGSQNEAGVTQFTLDLTALGTLTRGTNVADALTGGSGDDILMAQGMGDVLNGGAGADVLVTGSDQTRMTGGEGDDLFVIRDGSGTTEITDFRPGQDRLDLSGLPMLRDVGQLTLTSSATGAVLEYRGVTITITSWNGAPLTRADLFPDGFHWGDRFAVERPSNGSPGVSISGTRFDDRLDGTDFNDSIFGGQGNDVIYAFWGNDTIDAAGGNDLLIASGGRNLLIGGSGSDTIQGGIGADTLEGGMGRDVLYGDEGNDLIKGSNGVDFLYGGGGNDVISAGPGNDKVWAGEGNDLVRGINGRNLIFLEGGNDTAEGGTGDDRIFGGDGNDLMYGGAGNDTLSGDAGDDLLQGDDGDDVLWGGDGNDALWGGNGHDTLDGGAGDDWLSGMTGNDVIRGGAGNDVIRGGPGNDTIWGGDGADVFEFFRDHETGRIMDFNPADGDRLRLDDAIWYNYGALAAQQVVDQFGVMDGSGNVLLDFTQIGGNLVILDGYGDLAGVASFIDLM